MLEKAWERGKAETDVSMFYSAAEFISLSSEILSYLFIYLRDRSNI